MMYGFAIGLAAKSVTIRQRNGRSRWPKPRRRPTKPYPFFYQPVLPKLAEVVAK